MAISGQWYDETYKNWLDSLWQDRLWQDRWLYTQKRINQGYNYTLGALSSGKYITALKNKGGDYYNPSIYKVLEVESDMVSLIHITNNIVKVICIKNLEYYQVLSEQFVKNYLGYIRNAASD